MAIFNSLGSNYTFGLALRALVAQNKAEYRQQLSDFLEKRYGGKVILSYKGREALALAIRALDLSKKYTVGICGFTCYAVYEAVTKEGYQARYLDIAGEELNFSFEKLVEGIQKYPSIKVLIVQNTLGFPCEIEKIAKFCKDREIVLIEDLAHSIGAKYSDRVEVGTVGDITVLSFSQDKMIDGISGGALVLRSEELRTKNLELRFQDLGRGTQLRDRFYPLFTWFIRKTYDFGVGKILHAVLKKFDLLSKPMGQLQEDKIYGLPDWYCYLIYRQFMELKKDLIHRKKIASVYADELHENIQVHALVSQISKASNLRFPILTERRQELIKFLKKQGIFVSDIWYDSPIAPKRFLSLTNYNHECPNSEKISAMILNLPTHRNVSESDARLISAKINGWMRSSKDV